MQVSKNEDTLLAAKEEELKIILFWNSFFGAADHHFGLGQKPLIDAKCPVTKCFFTHNRDLFNRSEAIIFSIEGIDLNDLPNYRFPHQRFVFYEMESPATTSKQALYHNKTRFSFFNWTMTYRLDSDIYHRFSYGVSIPNTTLLPESYPSAGQQRSTVYRVNHPTVNINSKTKLVAWFVSHCPSPSRREDYVNELARHIPIDVYGKCGTLVCTDRVACYEMLKKYKFYLAFENSICADYVTEKFFKPLIYEVVPIVLGGADYTKFAPPHSYINALVDFKSPKELADYLWFLNSNDQLYARYFDWRKDYTISIYDPKGWCRLCKLVNDLTVPNKVYSDIQHWWMLEKDLCDPPWQNNSNSIMKML